MKSLENEQKLVMFTSVENMLARKNIPVNENLMSRVQGAADFFENVVNCIYSITDKDKSYDFSVKDLRKVLEFAGYSFKEYASQEKEELEKAIKDFKRYSMRFRELEDNPRRFFSDESRIRDIYEISSKMKNFYQRLVDEEDFRENSDD